MSKSAIKIPAPIRSRIMARAWEIFRTQFNYPGVPFASIGRQCFAWAMRAAWAEARDAAEIAATLSAEAIKVRIAETVRPGHAVGLSSSYAGSGKELMERMDRRRRFERALACAEFDTVAA